jgi:hypothetical protein
MNRPGRNDPCFCGSGKKFKKCHGSVEAARQESFVEVPIYRRIELPEIVTPQNISSYLEAFTSSFTLFSMPRVEAILHASRAVETQHIETELAASDNLGPSHQSLRSAQDLLRYLLYEIDKRCPEGGAIRLTQLRELEIAMLTASKFSELSVLRDLDLMVQYGWGTAEIMESEKLVRFVSEGSARADSAREYERVGGMAEQSYLAILNMDRQSLRRSSRLLEDSLTIGDHAAMTYSAEPDVVNGFYKAAKESSRSFAERLLPEDWRVGPYSISDYRAFYHLLQARCLMNSFAINHVSRRLLQRVPYNSASLILSRAELIQNSLDIGELTETATEEIIQDLTYNPREVKWTEVTYQPLIPLRGDLFSVVPVVVEGSSFDRNLLALIERLPWRKATAESLKINRENEMLRQLEPPLRAHGFAVASRVGLGEKTARLSDIDLLVWSLDGERVLVISLKWFYGPDSMQEVLNHSERYKKALAMQRKITDYMQDNLKKISNNHRLSPPLSPSARVLSALVTFQDEILERDRVHDIPSVTLPQFIRAVQNCGGSLDSLYDSICATSTRQGPEPDDESFERIKLGRYTFEVPVLYF